MLELRGGDFDAFFEAPFAAYGPRSPYVSPLKSSLARMLDAKRNPLFARAGVRQFFTAHRGRALLGRIVAHVHLAANALHGLRRSYFGFFDCVDDLEAARLLLGAAESFARSQGCDELAGNFNLTAMQQVGVLTDGFDEAPYTDQQYNPPHIPSALLACGFEPIFPMRTFETDLDQLDPRIVLGERAEERLRDPTLRWEPLRTSELHRAIEDIRLVLNDGFRDNPMFVPLTPEEIAFQAEELSMVLDPRITVLVHDAEGPVGTIVCIPDLNPLLREIRSRYSPTMPFHYLRYRLRRRRAVSIFYSVAQRMHNRGLNAAMLYRVLTAMRDAGYTRLGGTWIADVNVPSLRQVEKLRGRPMHRLHIFRKSLTT